MPQPDDVGVRTAVEEQPNGFEALRFIDFAPAIDVADLGPGRPVQRRRLRNIPVIDALVDRGGILAEARLDVLTQIEAHGFVQIDRAVGAHPIEHGGLFVVLGP